nr:unnamed protein product [Callosobruchus analis]
MKGINGVVGAIDGCHINTKKPREYAPSYSNRMAKYSKLIQGVCDHNKKFIDLLVGEAGSIHDASLLKRSSLYEKCVKGFLQRDFLIGDSGGDDTFCLDTGASHYAFGAVLSQEQDGIERVIEYYSKTLHKSQKNWCVTRKELYSVVKGIGNFHNLLYARRFVVRTDHSALQWLMKFKNPEGQLARWIEYLQTYDSEIRHRPGKHGNADSMSRRPCVEGCKH